LEIDVLTTVSKIFNYQSEILHSPKIVVVWIKGTLLFKPLK